MRKNKFHILLTILLGAGLGNGHAQLRVLVDQVGYEMGTEKQAIVEAGPADHPVHFQLVAYSTGLPVLEGTLQAAGQVAHWQGYCFWTADFSAWDKPGRYVVRVATPHGDVSSSLFEINRDLLERDTLSNVVYFIKGQRATGEMERAERHLVLPGEAGKSIDVHGGWWDATGDYGKHLSHQNLTSYFNPQQLPLTVWSLLRSYRILQDRGDENFNEYERRMLDEGLYGADYLVRIQRPQESFFETIDAPGKDKLAADHVIGNPNWRTHIKTSTAESTESLEPVAGPLAYLASYRAGGGVAIAALALAATMPVEGEFSKAEYLHAAERAFDFLEAKNRALLNDHTENILDDYCALLAATELYKASHEGRYLQAADQRANQLMARLVATDPWRDSWRADQGTRPFFHPSDAGLPVISLLEYRTVASRAQQEKVLDTVQRSLRFEMRVTAEVRNPFGYARQLVRRADGSVHTSFFFPHDTEAAPWWQGENARLASLAAAARMAMPLYRADPAFQQQLRAYAWNQLHWILGRNPFDVSMLIGSGHGDTAYMFFRSYRYTSAPGAILNGITSALDDEDGIAYNQGFAVTGKDEDWRWTEQWLPHASWYLLAVSLPE